MLPANNQPSSSWSAKLATSISLVFLFGFVVATRWPLAPRYLYYFDSANFALALEYFNPALHQPQPPGYPLFVLLIRLIHLWVKAPEQVLLIAGILASLAATVLAMYLARAIFGRPAGVLAAVLLVSDPTFWFAGVTNQIRLFLAVIAVGIGLLAWRALESHQPRRLYALFASLGIAAGFRPETALLFLPLLLWVWWRSGRSPRRLITASALMAACALPWFFFTMQAMGGPRAMLGTLQDYAAVQFGSSSLFFGATRRAAYKMFASAVVWTFLGTLAWIWAIPISGKSALGASPKLTCLFLVIGFAPTFLFSAMIHIGDPDQALAAIALLSVLGGGILRGLLLKAPFLSPVSLATVVLASHALIFFHPPGRLGRATGYQAVAAVDRMTTEAIESVRAVRGPSALTIVHYGSLVASRHLSYYFPEAYVIVLPAPGGPVDERPQKFYRHQPLPVSQAAGLSVPPDSGRILCFPPPKSGPTDFAGWQRSGPIYLSRLGACYLDFDRPLSGDPSSRQTGLHAIPRCPARDWAQCILAA